MADALTPRMRYARHENERVQVALGLNELKKTMTLIPGSRFCIQFIKSA